MGLSWQKYWIELLCLPPRDLLNPGIKPASPLAPALQVRFFTAEPAAWESPLCKIKTTSLLLFFFFHLFLLVGG